MVKLDSENPATSDEAAGFFRLTKKDSLPGCPVLLNAFSLPCFLQPVLPLFTYIFLTGSCTICGIVFDVNHCI